jgi:protein phosphatase
MARACRATSEVAKVGFAGGTKHAIHDLSHVPYRVIASLVTDVGCTRDTNEDCCRVVQPSDDSLLARKGVLVVIADGMGGHQAGEVASHVAIETIERSYYSARGDPREALKSAFREASREIHSFASMRAEFHGMGSTCTALVIQGGAAHAAHVGDTRLYLVRAGAIYRLTDDHSAVYEMVKQGLISQDEARHHPERNVILRALGGHPDVEVSTWEQPLPVQAGDQFVVCSDGLHDLVSDDEIRQVVLARRLAEACEALVDLARTRGGSDNITVAVVRIDTPDPAAEPEA